MSAGRTHDLGAVAAPLAEAAAWRVRLAESGLDSSVAFEAWLSADPAHREAWARVNGPWELVGEHATAPELMAARRDALDRARRHGRRRWRERSWASTAATAAVAVVALLASGAGFYLWQTQRSEVFRTVLGERRVIPLADGSTVALDSASELRVRYGGHARRLELIAGQARFDVAHDAQRPFTVRARDQLVIATGTAFNVDLIGPKVRVTLLEGSVEVVAGTERTPLARAVRAELPAPAHRQVLAAGEQLVADALAAPRVAKVDIALTRAWENGQLAFTDEPLAAVAERVGRYAGRPVRVAPDAAALRISGVFKTGDVETFVDTVTRYLPVSARTGEDGGVLLQLRH